MCVASHPAPAPPPAALVDKATGPCLAEVGRRCSGTTQDYDGRRAGGAILARSAVGTVSDGAHDQVMAERKVRPLARRNEPRIAEAVMGQMLSGTNATMAFDRRPPQTLHDAQSGGRWRTCRRPPRGAREADGNRSCLLGVAWRDERASERAVGRHAEPLARPMVSPIPATPPPRRALSWCQDLVGPRSGRLTPTSRVARRLGPLGTLAASKLAAFLRLCIGTQIMLDGASDVSRSPHAPSA